MSYTGILSKDVYINKNNQMAKKPSCKILPGSSVIAGSILGERNPMKRFKIYMPSAYVIIYQPCCCKNKIYAVRQKTNDNL